MILEPANFPKRVRSLSVAFSIFILCLALHSQYESIAKENAAERVNQGLSFAASGKNAAFLTKSPTCDLAILLLDFDREEKKLVSAV